MNYNYSLDDFQFGKPVFLTPFRRIDLVNVCSHAKCAHRDNTMAESINFFIHPVCWLLLSEYNYLHLVLTHNFITTNTL